MERIVTREGEMSERLSVLHVINSLGSGGAEKLLIEFIPIMQRKGIQADLVLLSKRDFAFGQELEEKGIQLCSLTNKGSVYRPLHVWGLIKMCWKYDIIHVHLFPAQYWVALASLFLPISARIITTEHSTHNSRMDWKWLRPLERLIYGQFNRIVSISAKTQEIISSWIREECPSNRCQVIENGIDLSKFQLAVPLLRRNIASGLLDTDRLLIMVARFSVQKDHVSLIKAMVDLPANYKLLLVGEGQGKSATMELCKALGILERVSFLGLRHDVPSLLKSADIAILSSHWEGFGLAAAEAMAAGVPLIASNVDGLREVVLGGGLLFEKGNSDDLAKKIKSVTEGGLESRELIIANQFDKVKQYDIERTVDQYIALYRKVLQE